MLLCISLKSEKLQRFASKPSTGWFYNRVNVNSRYFKVQSNLKKHMYMKLDFS